MFFFLLSRAQKHERQKQTRTKSRLTLRVLSQLIAWLQPNKPPKLLALLVGLYLLVWALVWNKKLMLLMQKGPTRELCDSGYVTMATRLFCWLWENMKEPGQVKMGLKMNDVFMSYISWFHEFRHLIIKIKKNKWHWKRRYFSYIIMWQIRKILFTLVYDLHQIQ